MRDTILFLVRGFLHLFYLFPIRRNRIVFECYMGKQYSCSPRAVSEYLREYEGERTERIWIYLDRPHPQCAEKQVKRGSLSWYFYLLTAGVVIMNSGFCQRIPFRKKQIIMNTWHGGGCYKKGESDPKFIRWYNRQITVFLSSCRVFSEKEIREGMKFSGEILNTGLPRNDILFASREMKAALCEKVDTVFQCEGKKLALYAPTWYPEKTENLPDMGKLKNALSERFGGEFEILLRMHYHSKERGLPGTIDATAYPDMQHLLLRADVLITDYSSVIWDYSLTGKPIFLYMPDKALFTEKFGFFTEPETWGFPLAESEDSLYDRIRNFDEETFAAAVRAHHTDFGSFEDGKACERVYEFLRPAVFTD